MSETTTTSSTTQRSQTMDEVIRNLAQLGGELTSDDDIKFEGTKFLIPSNMKNLEEAGTFLIEKSMDEEREMSFNRSYQYKPWDGAHATFRAVKKTFGMVRQVASIGMFGPNPPRMITVPVSVSEKEQIPWGNFQIPGLDGVMFGTGSERHRDYGLLFKIEATGPRKYRYAIEGVFNLIQKELDEYSIYRGKAFDGQDMPEFLDLSGVDESKVVYSADVLRQLEANVWALIKHREKLESVGESMKRAVLFEGPYGTGKTLGAYLTAQKAIAEGWTFIYCRPGQDDMAECMSTAKLYQPAVVFVEDVDVVADGEGNSDNVAKLLDIFDGIKAKGTKILAVLTTNHVEKIHKGMIRPGRLDAVIHIGAPDAAGIRKMAEAVIPEGLLGEGIDWDMVGMAMDGFLPAFVKETLSRSLRYSLTRDGSNGEFQELVTQDLVDAAEGLRPQLELMDNAKDSAAGGVLERELARISRGSLADIEVLDSGDDFFGKLVLPELG